MLNESKADRLIKDGCKYTVTLKYDFISADDFVIYWLVELVMENVLVEACFLGWSGRA